MNLENAAALIDRLRPPDRKRLSSGTPGAGGAKDFRRLAGCGLALAVALAVIGSLGASLPWIGLPLALAAMYFGALACRELGHTSRAARAAGLDVILCLCLPSALVASQWLAPQVVPPVRAGFEGLHLLGWAIVVFVLGGVAAVDRAMLGRIGLRILLPVLGASLAALVAGGIAVALLRQDAVAAFLLEVVPIMAGGLAAGALPLSVGYAAQTGESAGAVLAQVLPSVLAGNLAGIFIAGLLGHLCRQPQPGAAAHRIAPDAAAASGRGVELSLAALVVLHGLGAAIEAFWTLPSTLTVVLLASGAALLGLLPAPLRRGAVAVSAFSARHLLFPFLWLVGMVILPWDQIVAGFALTRLSVAVVVVLALAAAGFFLGRLAGMDPMEGAVIAIARAAMGGTGALAMLTAANRLSALPFALLVVRLGGALTIALALQCASLLRP